jgi:N-acetylmuramoyl-L-alanine amidase
MPDPTLTEHIVKAGECLASIAAACRETVESLWDHPANAELRALRSDPYVLAAGDRVMVPKPAPTTFVLQAGQRHVFRRRATHTDFEVAATLNGTPRADLDFTLTLDGDTANPIVGTSDADGVVRARIPAQAKRGVLEFADGRGRIAFAFGELDPFDTVAGVQGRLRDLGLYFASVDGVVGPYTTRALREFQKSRGLAVTGHADDPTKAALRAAYGR